MNIKHPLFVLGCATLAFVGCQSTPHKPADRFAAADANHDGVLNRTEVGAFYADSLFDAADKNNDGKVTLAEWTAGGYAANNFPVADANHDGSVTRDEARQYASTRPVIADYMKRADTNHDGVLSQAEVTAYYASREGPAR